MKLTDKNTITSKYEPKSKTVTWVDMSTGSPVMKKFINGMWRPVGSGGGNSGGGGSCNCNLPEPSQLNNGQVLSVGHGEPTGLITILPTTTLSLLEELENDVYIINNGYNPNVFSEGQEICLIFDNNTFYSTIQQHSEVAPGALAAEFVLRPEETIQIIHIPDDDNLYIMFSDEVSEEDKNYMLIGFYHNEYDYEYTLKDAANVLCPTDIVYYEQLHLFFARFKNLPEAGKAYYIPYLYRDVNSGTYIPIMLPCYILSIQQSTLSISGNCIQLFCPEYIPSGNINFRLSLKINNSMDTSANIYININGVNYEDDGYEGYYVNLNQISGIG